MPNNTIFKFLLFHFQSFSYASSTHDNSIKTFSVRISFISLFVTFARSTGLNCFKFYNFGFECWATTFNYLSFDQSSMFWFHFHFPYTEFFGGSLQSFAVDDSWQTFSQILLFQLKGLISWLTAWALMLLRFESSLRYLCPLYLPHIQSASGRTRLSWPEILRERSLEGKKRFNLSELLKSVKQLVLTVLLFQW